MLYIIKYGICENGGLLLCILHSSNFMYEGFKEEGYGC